VDNDRYIELTSNPELFTEIDSEELEEYVEFSKIIKAKKQEQDLKNLGLFPLSQYQPYRQQNDFHESDARVRIFLGGNFTGKTLAGACELAYWHKRCHPYKNWINQKKYPIHSLIIVVDHKQQKLPGAAQDKVLSLFTEDEIKKIVYNKHNAVDTIFLQNGDSITFKSSLARRETVQGGRVSCVWIDEDAIPSANYFDELQTRLPQDGDRLYIWFTMTPNLKEGPSWATEYLFPKCNKADVGYALWEASIEDNPYISDQAKEDILTGLVGDNQQVSARITGNWRVRKGLIYDFSMKHHVIPPLKQHQMDDLRCVFRAIDPHNAKPIAVLFAGVDKNNRVIIFDEIYKSGLVGDVSRWIKQRSEGLVHLIKRTIIDYAGNAKSATNGKSINDLFRENGIICTPCRKDLQGGIELVKKLLWHDPAQGYPPTLYVTANCTNTLREFRSYAWEPESQKSNVRKPMKRNDEMMDSIRYLVCDPVFKQYIVGKVKGKEFSNIDLDRATTIISTRNARIKRQLRMLGKGLGTNKPNIAMA
jgi:phage terminase large subunit